MFERYTEGARRVIFFARYEASQYGSPTIEPEHRDLRIENTLTDEHGDDVKLKKELTPT
jgi:hypothetical protein